MSSLANFPKAQAQPLVAPVLPPVGITRWDHLSDGVEVPAGVVIVFIDFSRDPQVTGRQV